MPANTLEISQRIQALVDTMYSVKSDDTNSAAYMDFVKSVNKLNEQVRVLCLKDKNGDYPKLTDDVVTSLIETYKETAASCQALMDDPSTTKVSTFRKDIAGQIRVLLGKDMGTLASLNPELTPTLPAAIEQARTLSVDLGKQRLDKISNSASVRMPMTITTEDGRQVSGFFTESVSQPTIEELYSDANQWLETNCPNKGWRFVLQRLTREYGLDNVILTFGTTANPVVAEGPQASVIASSVGKSTDVGLEIVREPGFLDMLRQYCGYAAPKFNAQKIYDLSLKLQPGSRIDDRNSSMSIIAGLIGRPDVIAHSQPLEVTIDGRKVSGTFMETAVGTDVTSLEEDDPILQMSTKNFSTPLVLRDVADLQILDYVCGNIDRHAGNIFYRFDDKGMISGITGIDNDSSFPTFVPNDYDAMSSGGTPFTEDLAISEACANKILHLNSDMLRYALRGTKLTPQEVAACCGRLEHLQAKLIADIEYFKDKDPAAIEDGHIHIIKDEDWPKVDFKKLAVSKDFEDKSIDELDGIIGAFRPSPLGRLFRLEKFAKENYAVKHRAKGAPKRDLPKADLKDAPDKGSYEEYLEMVEARRSSLASLSSSMDLSDPWYITSSKEFSTVKKELKEIQKYSQTIGANPTKDQIAALREKYIKVCDLTQIYVDKKAQKSDFSELGMQRLLAMSNVFATMHEQLQELDVALDIKEPTKDDVVEDLRSSAISRLEAMHEKQKYDINEVRLAVAEIMIADMTNKNGIPGGYYNRTLAQQKVDVLAKSDWTSKFLQGVTPKQICEAAAVGDVSQVKKVLLEPRVDRSFTIKDGKMIVTETPKAGASQVTPKEL